MFIPKFSVTPTTRGVAARAGAARRGGGITGRKSERVKELSFSMEQTTRRTAVGC